MKAKPKSAASNKARAKKPQPKSSRRKLAAALTAAGAVAAAVLIYMLAVAPNLGLVKLKPEGGKYIDKKNGIAYVPADVNYEPFAVGQPYAEAGSITLHEIPGLDPTVADRKIRGVSAIYHSDEIELPGVTAQRAAPSSSANRTL